MANAQKLFTIDKWNTGMADNPHVGFGKMVGVDTSSYQGSIRPNGKSTSKDSTFIPYWFTDNATTMFAIGDNGTNGKIYKSTDLDTWSDCTGYGTGVFGGATYWKGHTFAYHATAVDVMDSAGSADDDWAGLTLPTSTLRHPSLSSIDGNLYIGSGSKISQVAEVAGQTFAPATSGTYSATATILQLPVNATVYALADLGKYLMCMTDRGIYPWGRASGTSYNIPLVPDMTIYVGKTIENKLYFYGKDKTAGGPALYVTDGVNVQKLKDFPIYLFNYLANGLQSITPTTDAITYQDGNLLISLAIGVLGYNIKDGTLFIDNVGSIGEVAAGYSLSGGIYARTGVIYMWGYKNDTTYYIEKVNTGTGTATYSNSYAESPMYELSRQYDKRALGNVECVLYKPMSATSGFKLQYRKTLSDSWSDIKTVDYATYSTAPTITFPSLVSNANTVQFRVLFDNFNTTTPCILKEINIYG